MRDFALRVKPGNGGVSVGSWGAGGARAGRQVRLAFVALLGLLAPGAFARGSTTPGDKAEQRPGRATHEVRSPALTSVEQLGRSIFFDTRLSEPPGQSCASCHTPEAGWTGPDATLNAHGAVYEGAVPGRFEVLRVSPEPARPQGRAPPLHR